MSIRWILANQPTNYQAFVSATTRHAENWLKRRLGLIRIPRTKILCKHHSAQHSSGKKEWKREYMLLRATFDKSSGGKVLVTGLSISNFGANKLMTLSVLGFASSSRQCSTQIAKVWSKTMRSSVAYRRSSHAIIRKWRRPDWVKDVKKKFSFHFFPPPSPQNRPAFFLLRRGPRSKSLLQKHVYCTCIVEIIPLNLLWGTNRSQTPIKRLNKARTGSTKSVRIKNKFKAQSWNKNGRQKSLATFGSE